MVTVCAHYEGTVIELKRCETEEEANEFMKHDYILHYADEMENGEEELIYADEMFIEDEVPFCEPIRNYMMEDDELPF